MPIDITQQGSPGWWVNRLFMRLNDPLRRTRLQLLYNYRRGHARLPVGAQNAREAFAAFQRKARSNLAELIVAAVSERMQPTGFRTALDDDETGDAEVGALWERAGLDVESANVHDMMLTMSEAYIIVGQMDDDLGAPVVTGEDPRTMVAEVDPAQPRKLRAALKVLHDPIVGEDRAYLYLPGAATTTGQAQVWVARRELPGMATMMTFGPMLGLGWFSGMDTDPWWPTPAPMIGFSPESWSWDESRFSQLAHPRIPVVRFANKDQVGEFEAHLDLLDRINHEILQRMVIATMQAFRQRAIQGLPSVYPPQHPKAGQEIDYSEVFRSDPAAFWQLPAGATMWESAQVDLSGILKAIQDDLQHLAAVTRTPMHWLMPAGDNQSAEGASSQREGLVFKTHDRIARTSTPWAQVASLMALEADMPERADLAKLRTIWASPERLSLAERASAAVQLLQILPRRTIYVKILGMSPQEADRTMSELAGDELLAQQLIQDAQGDAASQGAVPGSLAAGGQPAGQQNGKKTIPALHLPAPAAGIVARTGARAALLDATQTDSGGGLG